MVIWLPRSPAGGVYTIPFSSVRELRIMTLYDLAGMLAQKKDYVYQFCLTSRHNTENWAGFLSPHQPGSTLSRGSTPPKPYTDIAPQGVIEVISRSESFGWCVGV